MQQVIVIKFGAYAEKETEYHIAQQENKNTYSNFFKFVTKKG